MANAMMKPLIDRLNRPCTRALETGAGICLARGHAEVGVEHLLAALLEDAENDVAQMLPRLDRDPGQIQRAVQHDLEAMRTGHAGKPVFAPALLKWFEAAWLEASLLYAAQRVRSGALLAVLVRDGHRFSGGDACQTLQELSYERIRDHFTELTDGSQEVEQAEIGAVGGGRNVDGGVLEEFCIDFTAKASEGGIDPVFGRDREIRQMVDILARRRKNNPLCVGEPGVGKTAVVEGLALRVAEDDVPESLAGVRILGLDLAQLQAGASVKGEFEKRLSGVIEAVKAAATPTILFIDEAHTLIGAGGAAGTGDAANLLKPALARGELRTIAATTWSEYKKYFEKDAALARRFQLVALDEPDIETTLTMLRGLRESYERAHDVLIRDDALIAAAEMGARYIAGRQHPDKGIDLVDTAAARVKVGLRSRPAVLQDCAAALAGRQRTIAALEREVVVADSDHQERLATLRADQDQQRAEHDTLEERWQAERAAATAFVEARDGLLNDEEGASKEQVEAARQALEACQEAGPLVPVAVDAQVVAQVVADWTGIPVGSMVKDQASALLRFEEEGKRRIKGQDHVMDIVGTGLRAAQAGLRDPKLPRGVFLFVGPSGVGKTETALTVADQVFGGERFMTTINMSEFQEKHSVSRLIGSPPGYVGYGEGGILTEAVRQRPYSVVLLDEVEKADLEVLNLFYQVFDKGTLSDSEGRIVDFSNTVIFLTSNLATDLITAACDDDELPAVSDLTEAVRPILSQHFKPALLARMTIVPFFTVDRTALRAITELKLDKLVARMQAQHGIAVTITPPVIEAIVERCTVVETGARTIDHIIAGTLMPQLAADVLGWLADDALPDRLQIDYAADTGFVITTEAP